MSSVGRRVEGFVRGSVAQRTARDAALHLLMTLVLTASMVITVSIATGAMVRAFTPPQPVSEAIHAVADAQLDNCPIATWL